VGEDSLTVRQLPLPYFMYVAYRNGLRGLQSLPLVIKRVKLKYSLLTVLGREMEIWPWLRRCQGKF
jgi:hypothetical protein